MPANILETVSKNNFYDYNKFKVRVNVFSMLQFISTYSSCDRLMNISLYEAITKHMLQRNVLQPWSTNSKISYKNNNNFLRA